MRILSFAISVSFVLTCGFAHAVLAQSFNSDMSPEAQRFNAYKSQRTAIETSIVAMKQCVQDGWRLRTNPAFGLLVTKVKVSVNAFGRVAHCEILQPSRSAEEDQSIQQFFVGFSFAQPPAGLGNLDLYLTLMTDGTMNLVEFADLPEAHQYYQQICGDSFMTPVAARPVYAPPAARPVYSPPGFNAPAPPATSQNVDFGPYMADVQRRLRRAFPGNTLGDQRVAVGFKIFRDGNVSDVRLARSSGNANLDQQALRAVQVSAPFHPLPVGSDESIDIQITFDHNMLTGH